MLHPKNFIRSDGEPVQIIAAKCACTSILLASAGYGVGDVVVFKFQYKDYNQEPVYMVESKVGPNHNFFVRVEDGCEWMDWFRVPCYDMPFSEIYKTRPDEMILKLDDGYPRAELPMDVKKRVCFKFTPLPLPKAAGHVLYIDTVMKILVKSQTLNLTSMKIATPINRHGKLFGSPRGCQAKYWAKLK